MIADLITGKPQRRSLMKSGYSPFCARDRCSPWRHFPYCQTSRAMSPGYLACAALLFWVCSLQQGLFWLVRVAHDSTVTDCNQLCCCPFVLLCIEIRSPSTSLLCHIGCCYSSKPVWIMLTKVRAAGHTMFWICCVMRRRFDAGPSSLLSCWNAGATCV